MQTPSTLKLPNKSYARKQSRSLTGVRRALPMVFLSALTLSIVSCGIDQSSLPVSTTNTVSETIDTQRGLSHFSDNLKIHYQVIDNRPSENCDSTVADGLCFSASLSLSLPSTFTAKNWSLYFSHMSPIQWADDSNFSIEHINGDLHRLSPNENYRGFSENQVLTTNIRATYWHLSKTDIMPNYYVTSGVLTPEIVKSTEARTDLTTGLEILPHAGEFSNVEKQLKRSSQDASIIATSAAIFQKNSTSIIAPQKLATALIPTPKHLEVGKGSTSLKGGYRLTGNLPERQEIQAALDNLSSFGIYPSDSGTPIHFGVLPTQSDSDASPLEAYHLTIKQDRIEILSRHARGAYYALRSLEGLLFAQKKEIAQVRIIDQPRYAFRGMHLDVARNFRDKQYVIGLLEQMSRYKLNRLHLHLGDDEGWRVEIEGLPELTQVGSKRCHDPSESLCLLPQLGSGPYLNSPANGYYSKRDYQDILQAAKARHIEVIPSFDMPGHSRAAVVSMENRYNHFIAKEDVTEAERYRLIDPLDKTRYQSIQFYNDNTLNVCLDSSYRFVDKVISEVIELHQQAQVPLTRYHIGADETAGAWINSPACQSLLNDPALELNDHHDLTGYFVERVANMVSEKGIVPAGWNDGMSVTNKDKMPMSVQSNAWTPLFWDGHAKAHEQANRQWQVVLSLPDVTYFDFPYAADPDERGYYWASRATDTQQAFEFMPDNLPAHAEIWTDRQNLPMTLDDRQTHLQPGVSFYGLQAHLWTETTRTDSQANHMIFPRLISLAERAWHRAEWEVDYNYQGQEYSKNSGVMTKQQKENRNQDWNHFANLLAQKELKKLDHYNIDYRIPTVGATIEDEQLKIQSPLPGLPLQYQVNNDGWTDYQPPVSMNKDDIGKLSVRALSADRQRAGRALEVF